MFYLDILVWWIFVSIWNGTLGSFCVSYFKEIINAFGKRIRNRRLIVQLLQGRLQLLPKTVAWILQISIGLWIKKCKLVKHALLPLAHNQTACHNCQFITPIEHTRVFANLIEMQDILFCFWIDYCGECQECFNTVKHSDSNFVCAYIF